MDKYHKAIDNLLSKGSLKLSFDVTRDLMTVLMSLRSIYYDSKSTNLTARAIHHYNQEGIMPSIPDTVKGRKKYNFYQILWLHVLQNLREMGYPLKSIKLIKGELIDKPMMKDASTRLGHLTNFSAFEFIVSMAALSDDPTHLIIMKDGMFSIKSGNAIHTLEDTYVSLPLSAFMGSLIDLMPRDSPFWAIKPKLKKKSIATFIEGEWHVKRESKSPTKIHIRLKDGRIEVIKKKDEPTVFNKLLKILQAGEYEEITVH
jgi:DNA-binding transcriptional MerR regulator